MGTLGDGLDRAVQQAFTRPYPSRPARRCATRRQRISSTSCPRRPPGTVKSGAFYALRALKRVLTAWGVLG